MVSETIDEAEATAFSVELDEFTGPFEVLLSLISKQKLELTALALHRVTDDFIKYVRAQGTAWNLDETTEFLVVAAILLDLKAARLLPGDSDEDEEDLALLEARDLLFARLLQYRAFKDASEFVTERMAGAPRWHPRMVGLDPDLAKLMPEPVIGIDLERFAEVAAEALRPKLPPEVNTDHVHAPVVSVQQESEAVVAVLQDKGSVSFRRLVAECPTTGHVVARFLSLLELYRQRAITFDQVQPLGDLVIHWSTQEESVAVSGEFDEEEVSA